MKEIRWSRKAIQQVEKIGEHIAIDSDWQARRIVRLLFATPEELRWSPRKGKIVPEFADPNLREITVYSWRLIYRLVDDARIEIAAVVHGRRLLRRSLLG